MIWFIVTSGANFRSAQWSKKLPEGREFYVDPLLFTASRTLYFSGAAMVPERGPIWAIHAAIFPLTRAVEQAPSILHTQWLWPAAFCRAIVPPTI